MGPGSRAPSVCPLRFGESQDADPLRRLIVVPAEPFSPVMLLVSLSILTLLMGSLGTWLTMGSRLGQGLPILPRTEVPPGNVPPLAVWTAAVWVLLLATGRIGKDVSAEPDVPDLQLVVVSLLVSGGAWLVLLAMLLVGHSTPRAALGLSWRRWPEQIGWGGVAYLAAVGPTWLMLFAMLPWRSADTQHAFLKLLQESPDVLTILLMALTATVLAPLSEELLFRVVLQGWLSERIGAAAAIPSVAVVFAGIHGWRDGIALLPLALILGFVFERRRSYLAVATTHALFNSVMFGLAWLTALAK
jgi:membrane protease YdiL (CAAX protease family)